MTENSIQKQYQGYCKTPLLWTAKNISGLEQFQVQEAPPANFTGHIPENLVLGKRVERYFFASLEKEPQIEILLKNEQIQNKGITIGEIDCILRENKVPVHIEIVYKFYLYDPGAGQKEIDQWTGPNRRDSLAKKLEKLKDRQLPLLYNMHTESTLVKVNLKPENMAQKVCFKAQLFAPYQVPVDFKELNRDCLQGFYVRIWELEQFSTCTFYIPVKVDWLQPVSSAVSWLNYEEFLEKISPLISESRSPLCWIRLHNGSLQKFFVVWW